MQITQYVFGLVTLFFLAPYKVNAQITPIPDPGLQSYFLKIDPKGTYLFVDSSSGDSGYPATSLDLLSLYENPNINLQAGDLIGFEQVGYFKAGEGFNDDIFGLGAVFYGSVGFLFPGPLTTATSFISLPTFKKNISTDVPQDFTINFQSTSYAQVPDGADRILFTVNDAFFSDNIDPNGDFGVYVKLTIRKKKYRIEKTIQIIDDNRLVDDVNLVSIVPSNTTCNTIKSSKANVVLKCIKINFDGSEAAAEGCKVNLNLSLGNYQAGHGIGHDLSEKPLGILQPSGTEAASVLIPVNGLSFQYEASEFSGEVNLSFDGLDPQAAKIEITDTVFQIKIPNLISLLDVTGLYFVNINSHPGDGFYGTAQLKNNLSVAIQDYKVKSILTQNVPAASNFNVKSEGASLVWGGAFDIGKNWSRPHCGHRIGNTIDISTSSFGRSIYTKRLKLQLAKSLSDKSFYWPVQYESPQDPVADHWHTVLNN